MSKRDSFQYVLAALAIIAVVVTIIMAVSRKDSSPRYGTTRYYGAPDTTTEETAPAQPDTSNMMPSGYNDGSGPINANMVAKLRSAGAAIQTQITHNPLKNTGGYNPVMNLREAPRGPAVNVTRSSPPAFHSSSALEDQLI